LPRACSTCARADVDQIDAALRTTEGFRAIAARFGIGRESLRRHQLHSVKATEDTTTEAPAEPLKPVLLCGGCGAAWIQGHCFTCHGLLEAEQGDINRCLTCGFVVVGE
jgi:rubrerythrin